MAFLAGFVTSACERAPGPLPQFNLDEVEPRVGARLSALRDAVRRHPDSAAVWGRLALNLQAHGYPEAAVEAFAAARELRPELFPYYYLPAILLTTRRDPRAGQLLGAARELRPDYTPLLLREAEWLIDRGRAEEAWDLLAGSAAERDQPAYSALLLGRAALAMGDTVRGTRQVEAAIAALPHYGEAHALLAELHRRSGDETRAELARERARIFTGAPSVEDPLYALVTAEGVSSRWHLLRGQSHMAAGDPASAIDEFREAVSILPDDAHAMHQLATALEAADRTEDAATAYRHALELRPDFLEATVGLARVLLRLDRPMEATDLIESVLASDSTIADAHLLLGIIEESHGRSARAVEAYLEGLRDAPFDRRIAVRLVWILAASQDPGLRDGRSAVALAERVCTIDMYREAWSLDALAAAYAEYGDFERALAVASRAAELAAQAGDTALATAIQGRIEGYEQGRPFRR